MGLGLHIIKVIMNHAQLGICSPVYQAQKRPCPSKGSAQRHVIDMPNQFQCCSCEGTVRRCKAGYSGDSMEHGCHMPAVSGALLSGGSGLPRPMRARLVVNSSSNSTLQEESSIHSTKVGP